MKIKLNGKEEQIKAKELTVLKLLEELKVESPDLVSVQLNGDFVEREDYESQTVVEGNQVEFLYFMGGGSGEVFQ